MPSVIQTYSASAMQAVVGFVTAWMYRKRLLPAIADADHALNCAIARVHLKMELRSANPSRLQNLLVIIFNILVEA